MPDDRHPRSSRPGSVWGAVKRAKHLYVAPSGAARLDVRRHAERADGVGRRKSLQIASRSIRSFHGTIWVPVSTVSVADIGRMYLWPFGSNQEKPKAKPGARKRFERSRGDEARGRIRAEGLDGRGLVAKRRSSVFDARRSKSKGRDERVRRVPISWSHHHGREFTKQGPAS